jgi:hypothetical protein
MLFPHKTISNTWSIGHERRKRKKGNWNVTVSDIKDIKKEDIESGLNTNDIDFYKIFSPCIFIAS